MAINEFEFEFEFESSLVKTVQMMYSISRDGQVTFKK
jgi:hypothetical protein